MSVGVRVVAWLSVSTAHLGLASVGLHFWRLEPSVTNAWHAIVYEEELTVRRAPQPAQRHTSATSAAAANRGPRAK